MRHREGLKLSDCRMEQSQGGVERGVLRRQDGASRVAVFLPQRSTVTGANRWRLHPEMGFSQLAKWKEVWQRA